MSRIVHEDVVAAVHRARITQTPDGFAFVIDDVEIPMDAAWLRAVRETIGAGYVGRPRSGEGLLGLTPKGERLLAKLAVAA